MTQFFEDSDWLVVQEGNKIDSVFWTGVGSSFHQPGTVNEKVLESDFVPLFDGTTKRCSFMCLM